MQYEQAYHFLISKLEHELPAYLTYHNFQHTKDMLPVAEQLCKMENVTGDVKELLLTAVLLHDAGFIRSYKDHEEQSCEIARETLPAFDYNKEEIDTICALIIATKSPLNPTTLLQKIICDADLHYLGTSHYFANANKLYNEYKHHGLASDRNDWHKRQIEFLEKHKYFTRSAINEFGSLKKKNLQLLTTKRKSLKKHESKLLGTVGDWILIVLGALTASYGLKAFLVPNGFFDGGVSGVALLLNKIFQLDLSLLIILINLPIIILSYFGTGKSFALKTIVAIILLGVFLHFIDFGDECV